MVPHEHPTQALLDSYSPEKTREVAGKKCIEGDMLHFRVALSNIYALVERS
jgi:aspartate carbamoyltransferase catalytic subunit